jgi:hypothetical protein
MILQYRQLQRFTPAVKTKKKEKERITRDDRRIIKRERRERERKVVLFIIHAPHQGRARTFADDDITTGFFFA